MTIRKTSSKNWLFFIVYSAFSFFYILMVVQPKLLFHIQQPSFILGKFYFHQFLSYPGGISEYIANFLMQFFQNNTVGSLILISIGFLFALPITLIYRKIRTGISNFEWVYLFLLSFFPLFNDYYFPLAAAIRVLFAVLGVWVFLLFAINRTLSFISYFVIAVVLYYLSGSGMFLVFSATTLFLVFYREKIFFSLRFCVFVIFWSILYPYIAYKYFFNISPSLIYFSFLPRMVKFMVYEPNILFYVFCFSLPVTVFLLTIYGKIKKSVLKDQKNVSNYISLFSKYHVVPVVFILIVVVATYFSFNSTIDRHQKNKVVADYYCYNGRWDKVIEIALSDKEYDYQLNLNYNRAIDQSGLFVDQFFAYPQMVGEYSIYPDYMFAGEAIFASSDFYYDLGYISEAKHWAYEALVYFPYSQRALKRLVLSHLILGEYESACRYLRILDKGLLAHEFVEKYQPLVIDTSLIANNQEILQKRQLLPKDNELLPIMSKRFLDLFEANPNNKSACDHLLIDYLLNHQLDLFADKLNLAHRFYKKLPSTFEQAILVYCFNSNIDVPERLSISNASFKKFSDFTNILIANKGGEAMTKRVLSEKFSDTYMYYIKYNSPKVTKAVLQERKDNDPI